MEREAEVRRGRERRDYMLIADIGSYYSLAWA